MSEQPFRENVADDIQSIMDEFCGTAWGEDEWGLHQALTSWAERRFGPPEREETP